MREQLAVFLRSWKNQATGTWLRKAQASFPCGAPKLRAFKTIDRAVAIYTNRICEQKGRK